MGEMPNEPAGPGTGGPDPDAPWRRGFEGWSDPAEPAGLAGADGRTPDQARGVTTATSTATSTAASAATPTAQMPRSFDESADPGAPDATGRRRAPLVIAALILVVAAIVIVGAAVFRSDGEAAGASPAPMLPASIDRSWSVDIDAGVDAVAITDDLVVIGAAGGLTVLDLADGETVWSRPAVLGGPDIDIERIAVVDDLVLVQMASIAGSDVRSFDVLTGDDLWASDGGGGAYTIQDPTDRPSVLRRSRVDGVSVGQLIDSPTGAPLGEPMMLSSVSATGRHLGIESGGRQVAAWSTDRQEIAAGPVDSFGLREVAVLGGVIVALDLDGRIAAFDEDGARVDALLVSASPDGDSTVRADLLGVVESASTAVVGSDRSIGFTVDDGEISVRWERDGRVSQLLDVDWGTAGLLVEPGESGAPRVVVIDAATGATIATPPAGGERLPTLADDGYLVAPEPGSSPRVLRAFDFDDRELWSLPISEDADWELLDDAVLVVETSPESSMLTVAR